MSNDMLIAGSADDPAAVRGSDTVAALARIAAAGQPFVSRGTTRVLTSSSCRFGSRPVSIPWGSRGTRRSGAA
jgi:tungstate transport system substrate-binding protein